MSFEVEVQNTAKPATHNFCVNQPLRFLQICCHNAQYNKLTYLSVLMIDQKLEYKLRLKKKHTCTSHFKATFGDCQFKKC